MSDTNEAEGPFSEFAEPQTGALEDYKDSLANERAERRQRRMLLLMLLVGGALGASLGEAYAAAPRAQPLAFVLALGGGIVGALAGWGTGAASWAWLAFQTKTYLPDTKPLGADMVRGNQWDKLTVWMAVWGSLGVAFGASIGAGMSIEYFDQFAGRQPPPWQWFGACAGLLLSMGFWTLLRSSIHGLAVLAALVVGSVAACWLLGG